MTIMLEEYRQFRVSPITIKNGPPKVFSATVLSVDAKGRFPGVRIVEKENLNQFNYLELKPYEHFLLWCKYQALSRSGKINKFSIESL
jgi:hypothetical protein